MGRTKFRFGGPLVQNKKSTSCLKHISSTPTQTLIHHSSNTSRYFTFCSISVKITMQFLLSTPQRNWFSGHTLVLVLQLVAVSLWLTWLYDPYCFSWSQTLFHDDNNHHHRHPPFPPHPTCFPAMNLGLFLLLLTWKLQSGYKLTIIHRIILFWTKSTQSNYYYNWQSLKYRIRHPLVVARYRPIRWIKPDKWDLGRKRVVWASIWAGFHFGPLPLVAVLKANKKGFLQPFLR